MKPVATEYQPTETEANTWAIIVTVRAVVAVARAAIVVSLIVVIRAVDTVVTRAVHTVIIGAGLTVIRPAGVVIVTPGTFRVMIVPPGAIVCLRRKRPRKGAQGRQSETESFESFHDVWVECGFSDERRFSRVQTISRIVRGTGFRLYESRYWQLLRRRRPQLSERRRVAAHSLRRRLKEARRGKIHLMA